MAFPKTKEARNYYRCAKQRFEDALVLDRADRTTGAVYLAGYGVECILKSLILEGRGPKARAQMLREFRGQRAHSFDWLRDQYRRGGGAPFPKEVNEQFLLVVDWSTDLRYVSGVRHPEETGHFLRAANAIIVWAEGRL